MSTDLIPPAIAEELAAEAEKVSADWQDWASKRAEQKRSSMPVYIADVAIILTHRALLIAQVAALSAERDVVEVKQCGLCGLSGHTTDEHDHVARIVGGGRWAVSGERIRLRETRGMNVGRIEFEWFGSTPFDQVPESPYYVPSPGSHLSTRAWMDEDGEHVVVAHDCITTREVHTLHWPTWQAVDGQINPSYQCDRCGVHTFVPIAFEEVRA